MGRTDLVATLIAPTRTPKHSVLTFRTDTEVGGELPVLGESLPADASELSQTIAEVHRIWRDYGVKMNVGHPYLPVVEAWQELAPVPALWDGRDHSLLPAPLAAVRYEQHAEGDHVAAGPRRGRTATSVQRRWGRHHGGQGSCGLRGKRTAAGAARLSFPWPLVPLPRWARRPTKRPPHSLAPALAAAPRRNAGRRPRARSAGPSALGRTGRRGGATDWPLTVPVVPPSRRSGIAQPARPAGPLPRAAGAQPGLGAASLAGPSRGRAGVPAGGWPSFRCTCPVRGG